MKPHIALSSFDPMVYLCHGEAQIGVGASPTEAYNNMLFAAEAYPELMKAAHENPFYLLDYGIRDAKR